MGEETRRGFPALSQTQALTWAVGALGAIATGVAVWALAELGDMRAIQTDQNARLAVLEAQQGPLLAELKELRADVRQLVAAVAVLGAAPVAGQQPQRR